MSFTVDIPRQCMSEGNPGPTGLLQDEVNRMSMDGTSLKAGGWSHILTLERGGEQRTVRIETSECCCKFCELYK